MADMVMLDQLLMDFKNTFGFASTDQAGTAVLQSLSPSDIRALRRNRVTDDPNLYKQMKQKAESQYQIRMAGQ